MVKDGTDKAYDGQVRYLISYYDNLQLCRKYYLNRSSFPDLESAKREVRLLKIREQQTIPKRLTNFKIEKTIITKAINKSCG